jgi:D-alanyl-D-alanine carboxypeptidase (penicillin-binding protein 5/6)
MKTFDKFNIKPFLAFVFVVFLGLGLKAPAQAEIMTQAEFAVIMDYESGDILFEKNADAPMKPASMAKLMTTYLLFEQLQNGSIRFDDKFLVSEKAYRKGGSRMFLEIGDQVEIADLLRGIIVQSGNDAAIVVAEGLAGTEETFAEEMTERAKSLGMSNTVFGNSTGWPDEVTTTTARDLAILAQAMIKNHPEFYGIYSEKTFTYNKIKQNNRNPILYTMDGADGLKTGHTEESGYGLVASAVINGQRMIMVLNGLDSSKTRKSESLRLMTLAFQTYKKFDLIVAGEEVKKVPVWMGVEPGVPLVSPETISKVMSRTMHKTVSQRVVFPDQIDAPIKKGQNIGQVFLSVDGVETAYPLVAGKDVDQLPFFDRIGAFFKYLIFGAEALN